MQTEIKKYPVRHPILKNHIKFFWELHIEQAQLNHKIIPQRNINLRFNLNDTPHFIQTKGILHRLEDIYFPGLQDHYHENNLLINGKADVLGVCFKAEGFYPFFNIPVSEYKNQILGAREIGFKLADSISERLKDCGDVDERLEMLENELAQLLIKGNQLPENFRTIFHALKQGDNAQKIALFCRQNKLDIRTVERAYNKYVGVSANTYGTLYRFHNSLNQLLYKGYSKLSDVAYDNGYFDQTHFIRDFKRFAGNTPKRFVHQNNSILQIGKLA
jgi:AraC-like DNA-binding protein